eukprot:GFKZ01010159.1.p1 GENE.GFKZ01010159.1~~GFKZ01010159.1.p1  ORF type:complete len:325 (+),score=41.56 GFKZ01010159.1:39-1013(+)
MPKWPSRYVSYSKQTKYFQTSTFRLNSFSPSACQTKRIYTPPLAPSTTHYVAVINPLHPKRRSSALHSTFPYLPPRSPAQTGLRQPIPPCNPAREPESTQVSHHTRLPFHMATNIVWHDGVIAKEHRYAMLKQKGATIWLTGLSGSGKSTVSVALEQMMFKRGYLVYRLDGDNIRFGLNSNLGFSADDRKENIRRISEVAKLMGDVGVITTSAFISPYVADRQVARQIHEKAGIPFVEVHVDVPLEVAEQRDPKGLYKKARKGEIKNFTGIDDPYEAPETPEVKIDTDKLSVNECAEKILEYLIAKEIVPKKDPVAENGTNGTA